MNDIHIPKNCIMKLNTNFVNISTLIIDGTLIIDDSIDFVEIYAKNINIALENSLQALNLLPFPKESTYIFKAKTQIN